MLTATDLSVRFGVPLRSAQRLLGRWHREGRATTVPTGGRPALAIDRETAARLLGLDADDLARAA